MGRRPLIYPLIFKSGLSDPQIISLQVLLSTLSYGLLAYSLARLVSRPLGHLIFAATLLSALVTPVNAWDLMIRSESTSNSLLALTLAFALLFCRALPTPGLKRLFYAAATALFGAAAALARDTNPYVLLLLVPVILASAWLSRARWVDGARSGWWSVGTLVVWLSAACFTAQWTARAAPRYDFPLMNVIFKRILPSAPKRDYFVRELHMPVNRQLMSRARKFASANGRYAYREPELDAFRDWIFTRGYTAYQRYLVSHLHLSALEAYADFSPMVGYIPGREGRFSTTALTEIADEWLVLGFLKRHPLGACILFASVGTVALCMRCMRTQILGLTSLFLVVATLSQLFICYHADSMEVFRHGVSVGILLRLALVVALAVTLNLAVAGAGRLMRLRDGKRSGA